MTYEIWLEEVRDALRSINMPMQDWQGKWPFDFSGEHDAGATPDEAAMKANRYWWHQQNKSLKSGLPDDDQLPAASGSSGQMPACFTIGGLCQGRVP